MVYLIQAIGIVGAIFAFIAFLNKHHFKILIIKTCSVLCFALQFGLMRAYTGMAMNIVEIAVLLTSAVLVAKNKKTLPFVVAACFVCAAVGALSWVGYASLLAIAGELFVTVASGVREPKYLRVVFFFGSLCWLIYDCVYFSLGGIVTEVFSLTSIIIATVLLLHEERKRKKQAEPAPKEE